MTEEHSFVLQTLTIDYCSCTLNVRRHRPAEYRTHQRGTRQIYYINPKAPHTIKINVIHWHAIKTMNSAQAGFFRGFMKPLDLSRPLSSFFMRTAKYQTACWSWDDRTDPDRSPSDVVTVEELLDVDAVRNETFERYRVHVDGVSKHDQLYTDRLGAHIVCSVYLL